MDDIIKVKSFDQLPPVVQDMGIAYSTRILEHKHRKMKDALMAIADNGMDAKQCRDTALMVLDRPAGQ